MKRLFIGAALAALGATGAIANGAPKEILTASGVLQSAQGLNLSPADPTQVIGLPESAANLHRERDEVRVRASFSGLQPDSVYTVWWFFFNQPEKCDAAPCTVENFFFDGLGQAFNAGGFFTDAQGLGDFAATLPRGDKPNGAQPFSAISMQAFGFAIDDDTETGLRRPYEAEVRIVARYHGPRSANVLSQFSEYFGASGAPGALCDADPDTPDCYDDQIVIFPPAF